MMTELVWYATATACKSDVKKFCQEGELYPETGAVLTCLREVKDQLSSACSEEVFRTQASCHLLQLRFCMRAWGCKFTRPGLYFVLFLCFPFSF